MTAVGMSLWLDLCTRLTSVTVPEDLCWWCLILWKETGETVDVAGSGLQFEEINIKLTTTTTDAKTPTLIAEC